MSFTSVMFCLFVAAGLIVYYLLPKKFRWILLLVMSYAYYFTFSVKTSVIMVATTIIVYVSGRLLDSMNVRESEYLADRRESLSKEERKAYKASVKKKKRAVTAVGIILAFGILAAVKYCNFAIENINSVLSRVGSGHTLSLFDIVLPLGISFYTFQSVSYIIDVYQGKYRSENNIFKFALFVSFFPQLLQGPIGRFDRLGHQLYEGHEFNLKNIQFGIQRVGWGIAKKVILADRAAPLVTEVFTNYGKYTGYQYIMALLMYSVELYMDFSGGIDISIGVAQMFGITMDENFRQPYFSKSIGEFWRRWHITLGTWMKDYIFYPMSLSSGMHKFTKWSKKHLGEHAGKTLPICFANILIFFVVGIWHGAAWKYIFYGLYNGFIIAFSNMAAPLYKKCLEVCHINPKRKAWQVFQIIRTFVLVNIGWYFDMAGGVRSALCMMKYTLLGMTNVAQLTDESLLVLGMNLQDYGVVAAGCIVVFIVSVLKERGVKIRESIARKPLAVRWLIYYAVFALILIVGYSGNTGGFIYANF